MKLVDRINGKIIREKNERIADRVKSQLKGKDVSIISQNCIGGVMYHDMGMEFKSPTINLFIYEPDFVRMVNNLEYYMNSDIEITMGAEYPVGVLGGDVHIGFMHYHSCEEARENWEERKKRINWDNIVVFATDRDGFNDDVFDEWKNVKYPKVLFTSNEKYKNEPGTVVFPEYESEGFVPDLIPKREFYKDNIVIDVLNSVAVRKDD